MTDYAAKVAAGIKLLDSKKPGWRSKIVMDDLDLASCDVCVLGQVFGSYDTGKADLGLDTYDAKSYGFNTDYSMEELTRAWKDALGTNSLLVEKGQVYKNAYGDAVKVIATSIVPLSNTETITAYIVKSGSVSGDEFKEYGSNVYALQKKDFEGSGYTIKVEKFVPKKGMFVQNDAGAVFYMTDDYTVREVKNGATTKWLSAVDNKGLKEVKTAGGKKFSESLVK